MPSASGQASKLFREGTDRAVPPSSTLDQVKPHLPAMGITRVANLTGLDRVGLPVVAVCRPNSRSLSVSQGKGLSLAAAEASGLMESVEAFHAERMTLPLLLGSYDEVRRQHPVADPRGLPRRAMSRFTPDLPLLWVGGADLLSATRTLVPYELVHLDLRVPFPTGTGAFLMSSNGLASGNHLLEATSHAICELVERDANSLFRLSGETARAARRIDLATIRDPTCQEVLDRFAAADIGVLLWNVTSDIEIPSILCTVVDRDRNLARPMVPISGSGCHPRPEVALLRALTEAAQGRLTLISGSRDDLSQVAFDTAFAMTRGDGARGLLRDRRACVSFEEVVGVDHECFDDDVKWELERLAAAGVRQVIAVNLTLSAYQIPVVRVVIPFLEAMSEAPGYVPGPRARGAVDRVLA